MSLSLFAGIVLRELTEEIKAKITVLAKVEDLGLINMHFNCLKWLYAI